MMQSRVTAKADGAAEDVSRSPRALMQVCSGARHCAALTDSGAAFAWGWNKFGQLGVQTAAERQCEPSEIRIHGGTIADVSCGWWHTLFLVRR